MSNKIRSIRMSDENYSLLTERSEERGLSINDFIGELLNGSSKELPPDLLCRLIQIKNYLQLPLEDWSAGMKEILREDVVRICAYSNL